MAQPQLLLGLFEGGATGEEVSKKILNTLVVDESPETSQASDSTSSGYRRPVRIYADGVFDLIHSGHFNAFRQARKLGDVLVVGVCSDEEVFAAKKYWPVFSQSERAELVRGCKWVDEVVENTPYTVPLSFLNSVRCDFVAHGDDFAPGADGNDCYGEVRSAGRLKIFKRTAGVSSSTLVARILVATSPRSSRNRMCVDDSPSSDSTDDSASCVQVSTTIPVNRLLQFIGTRSKPRENQTVAYVHGGFDVIHVGHLRLLSTIAGQADYLIIGIHDDSTVMSRNGDGYPILPLHERALNILALRCVDDVIFGVPATAIPEVLASFRIDNVVDCSHLDLQSHVPRGIAGGEDGSVDLVLVAKAQEIQRRIVEKRDMLMSTIDERTLKESKLSNTHNKRTEMVR